MNRLNSALILFVISSQVALAQSMTKADFQGDEATALVLELTQEDSVRGSVLAKLGGSLSYTAMRLPSELADVEYPGETVSMSGSMGGYSALSFFDGAPQDSLAVLARFSPVLAASEEIANRDRMRPGVYLSVEGLDRQFSVVLPSDDDWETAWGRRLPAAVPDLVAVRLPQDYQERVFRDSGSMFNPIARVVRDNMGILSLSGGEGQRSTVALRYALPVPGWFTETTERILKAFSALVPLLTIILSDSSKVNRGRYFIVLSAVCVLYIIGYSALFYGVYKYGGGYGKVAENGGFIALTVFLAAVAFWMKGGSTRERETLLAKGATV